MNAPHNQWIGGAWREAHNGQTSDIVDPATEEVIATVPFGDGADATHAIEAAQSAFPAWAGQTAQERGAILTRAATLIRTRRDELARLTTTESGKPLREAAGEWSVAADLFEWYAEEGKRAYGRTIPSRVRSKRHLVLKQPMGVVGVITAWNFPAYNPARAWAAALAAGCTVVARPSELTPLTAMALTAMLEEAGLPGGALNLINGDPASMAQAMLDHEACRKISFTGSVRVGRLLMDGASRTFTRLALELGGNAPVLVFDDVDLDALAKSAVTARFRNAGQVCVAPQRFLVHQKRRDELAERLARHTRELKVGNGLDDTTHVGPMINEKQRDRVVEMVGAARAQGAQVLAGGGRPAHLERGYFVEPTVVTGVSNDMPLSTEEIFGPVLPLLSFDDIDQALAIANATPYGLAAYVFTNNMKAAIRCWEGLDFGMIGVNDWAAHATEAPFGGRKHSGLGHESGPEGLQEYLETKLVTLGGL
jgi:succinate-semialdehyde dehydrogenase